MPGAKGWWCARFKDFGSKLTKTCLRRVLLKHPCCTQPTLLAAGFSTAIRQCWRVLHMPPKAVHRGDDGGDLPQLALVDVGLQAPLSDPRVQLHKRRLLTSPRQRLMIERHRADVDFRWVAFSFWWTNVDVSAPLGGLGGPAMWRCPARRRLHPHTSETGPNIYL